MKSLLYSLVFQLLLVQGLFAQCFEPDASIWLDTWASCSMSSNPKAEYGSSHWIQYDFGEVRQLSKTWVWNTNDPSELDRGFNQVKVDYSIDGSEWIYWGEMNFPMAPGTAIYGGFPGPDLVDLEARFVLLTASSNHGDPSCSGLAEIKFNLLPEIQDEFPEVIEDCEELAEIEAYVEELTPTEAYISFWSETVGDVYYVFQYWIAGTEEIIEIDLEEPELFLEFLEPNTTYEYRITVECEEELFESELFSFTTPDIEDSCLRVDDIWLIEATGTNATIGWEGVGDEDFYYIRYGLEDDPYLEGEEEVEGFSIALSNLEPNTDYQLRVGLECEEYAVYSAPFYFSTEGTTSTFDPKEMAFFKVFPNPTRGQFNLEYYSQEQDYLHYTIITTLGEVVLRNNQTLTQGQNIFQLDLTSLPDGLYLIQGHTQGQQQISGRIVKIKG